MRTRESPRLTPELRAVIADAARKHGVPLAVALAFADVESRFDPGAEGDLDWPTRKASQYRKLVLEQRASSPWAQREDLWHSYGLYQLLAAQFVRGDENPQVLLDPVTNADRGLQFVAALLKRAGGDAMRARLRYVGCGFDGEACSHQRVTQVRERFAAALQRYA